MSSEKCLSVVEIQVWKKYVDIEDDNHALIVGDYCLDFNITTDMESIWDGIGWGELCEPITAQLTSWIEKRKPTTEWHSFSMYTLWELEFTKSYCWEYETYEYDSYATCLGLIDKSLWTPERLGLVEAVES